MTNSPRRLGAKFSLKSQPRMQPAQILPIFQRWIQERRVAGMLIDVIDYKHVEDGPSVVLIADEADYSYDLADGQPGLNYIQKRELPDDLEAALRLVVLRAMQGAQALQAEAPDDLVFDYSAVKISFIDRMRYRNDAAVYERLRPELSRVMSAIYGADVTLSLASQDRRHLLAVHVEAAPESIDLEDISRRLLNSLERTPS